MSDVQHCPGETVDGRVCCIRDNCKRYTDPYNGHDWVGLVGKDFTELGGCGLFMCNLSNPEKMDRWCYRKNSKK